MSVNLASVGDFNGGRLPESTAATRRMKPRLSSWPEPRVPRPSTLRRIFQFGLYVDTRRLIPRLDRGRRLSYRCRFAEQLPGRRATASDTEVEAVSEVQDDCLAVDRLADHIRRVDAPALFVRHGSPQFPRWPKLGRHKSTDPTCDRLPIRENGATRNARPAEGTDEHE